MIRRQESSIWKVQDDNRKEVRKGSRRLKFCNVQSQLNMEIRRNTRGLLLFTHKRLLTGRVHARHLKLFGS